MKFSFLATLILLFISMTIGAEDTKVEEDNSFDKNKEFYYILFDKWMADTLILKTDLEELKTLNGYHLVKHSYKRLFKDEFNPFEVKNTKFLHYIHEKEKKEIDQIVVESVLGGRSVTIKNSHNFTKVTIELTKEETLTSIKVYLNKIFLNEGGGDSYANEWKLDFEFIKSIENKTFFTNNLGAKKIYRIGHIHEKIDVFIENSKINIYFCRKPSQIIGLLPNNEFLINENVEGKTKK
jgi:hypothetical protein